MLAAFGLLLPFAAMAADYPATALRRAREGYVFSPPATAWQEALPIGNGRLAALLMGAPGEETIVLNEESVWAPPKPRPINPRGPALVPRMRRLILEGKEAEAERLYETDFAIGKSEIAPFQPMATLRIRHTLPEGRPTGYRRGIRLDEGVAHTTFHIGGAAFSREAFVAYDDDTLCLTYAARTPGTLTFSLTFERPGDLGETTVMAPNLLRFAGATGKGGVAFDILAEVESEDGSVAPEGEGLRVAGATRAFLRLTAYTDHNRRNPDAPLTRDRLAACAARLDALRQKGHAAIRANHAVAFGERFRRGYVDFGEAPDTRPLEARLGEARKNKRLNPDFLLLNADFCRYLLLSSSHAGGLPATLQGKWNPLMDPLWLSDWHLDMNLSMFHWPAGPWGLAEAIEPAITLAEMAFPRGRRAAREMMGVEEGSFLNVQADVWGTSTPYRIRNWGMYVCGGAWLLQDAMDAYRYTEDEILLRRLLPLLREQSLFFLNWGVREPSTGKWLIGPCFSPENAYRTRDGSVAGITLGSAHDQQLADATFRDFLMAARRLTPDDPLIARVEERLATLAPGGIVGPDGALQEWFWPYGEADPAHRHLSFAYALMPGRAWSPRRTPALAEATRKRLDLRQKAGHQLMGWSIGHMACLRARLNQPEEAMAVLDHAPRYLTPNLFTTACGYPQVANLGGVPAALNEMLLRTDGDLIEVLPALPERLGPKGSFRLTALRGVVVGCAWKEGRVTRLTLTAKVSGDYAVRVNGATHTLSLKAGTPTRL